MDEHLTNERHTDHLLADQRPVTPRSSLGAVITDGPLGPTRSDLADFPDLADSADLAPPSADSSRPGT